MLDSSQRHWRSADAQILQSLAIDTKGRNELYGHIEKVWGEVKGSAFNRCLKPITYDADQSVSRWKLKKDQEEIDRVCSWEESLFWIFVVNHEELGFLAEESWRIMKESHRHENIVDDAKDEDDEKKEAESSCKGIDRILDVPMVWILEIFVIFAVIFEIFHKMSKIRGNRKKFP